MTNLKSLKSKVVHWWWHPIHHPSIADWNPKKANPANAALWQVEWDTDDAPPDDFAKQLAQELERAKQATN